MRPLYSHSTRENVTPSGGISPLASCMGVPPPPPSGVLGSLKIFCVWQHSKFFKRWMNPASYPDIFLSREGGKERKGRCLPSVPFTWSLAVHHQSLLYLAKREAPEEEAGMNLYTVDNTVEVVFWLVQWMVLETFRFNNEVDYKDLINWIFKFFCLF